jgi:hypothetical protein
MVTGAQSDTVNYVGSCLEPMRAPPTRGPTGNHVNDHAFHPAVPNAHIVVGGPEDDRGERRDPKQGGDHGEGQAHDLKTDDRRDRAEHEDRDRADVVGRAGRFREEPINFSSFTVIFYYCCLYEIG